MTIFELIQALTPADAAECFKQSDPLCWIEYTLLDPNNLSRRFATRVEDALFCIA